MRLRICNQGLLRATPPWLNNPASQVGPQTNDAAWCRCGCGRPLAPRSSRGLAIACYNRHLRRGDLDDVALPVRGAGNDVALAERIAAARAAKGAGRKA